MYIFSYLRKDFFTKFFIINKKTRIGDLRGFKSVIVQKSLFSKFEETMLSMYNSDLIESLSGFRPNILKVIFKIPKKKKKRIIVLLQTKLNSTQRVTGVFDTLSIFVMKLSNRIIIKGKQILAHFSIRKKSNYLHLNAGNFPHLLWSTSKMFDYSLKRRKSFDLSFLLSFCFSDKKIVSLHQISLKNLLRSWLKTYY